MNGGRGYAIPAVGLRFFNIYGTWRSHSNPYTGVLVILASRYLNGKAPLINEDGYQQRDFVSVYDVARTCRLALEVPDAADRVFNVGSGAHYTIREIAAEMARAPGKEHIVPEITGRYRMRDPELFRRHFARKEGARIRAASNFRNGTARSCGLAKGPLRGRPGGRRITRVGRARLLTVRKSGTHAPLSRHRKQGYVLITGGSGFIDANLPIVFCSAVSGVVLYDNLSRAGVKENHRWLREQHNDDVKLERADTRNSDALRKTVEHASAVFIWPRRVW